MAAPTRTDETLRALVYDLVVDVIFYLAVEGEGRYRFQSVNRAFLEATGLEEREVVGRLVDEVIPRPSLDQVKAKYAEAISTRQGISWEEVSRYPAGTKHGEVTVCPVFDADGCCTHLIGTVHDITTRHEAELQRRRLEAQLHQAQRLQELGTLAGGIAHDFNNILVAIFGNVDLALGSLRPDDAARENLLEIKRAAERASDMVLHILTFSRRSEPRRELVEPAGVIREALKLLGPTTRGATLAIELSEDTPQIHGDATQIHQVVVNLVTNALHALGNTAGAINVKLEPCSVTSGTPDLAEGRYARLTVSDNGSGMDEETLAHVFEPFFTTKPATGGTGLGLSVVHGIVSSHGGAVRVRSEPGKGTDFEVYLPAADRTAGASTSAAGPDQGPGGT